jgi:hypothetical protein
MMIERPSNRSSVHILMKERPSRRSSKFVCNDDREA